MNQVLIISGPTATGKTKLAVSLANHFNGELISADSRQIYRGMDIGTGKDHPPDIKIHLIDIKDPDQTFSAAEYRRLAIETINQIYSRGKLPIIVGGTGQYIDSIINPQPTFNIKPNKILRFILNRISTTSIQKIYKLIDKKEFYRLNNSEQHNRHRLIRKIEIKLSSNNNIPLHLSREGLGIGFNVLHISLTAPNSYIYSQIDSRAQDRLNLGLIQEIKNLLSIFTWSAPGLNCLAYKDFKNYLEGKELLSTAVEHWQFSEHALARRQKTWFKKIPNIKLIDVTSKKFQSNTLNLVAKWYNKS